MGQSSIPPPGITQWESRPAFKEELLFSQGLRPGSYSGARNAASCIVDIHGPPGSQSVNTVLYQ